MVEALTKKKFGQIWDVQKIFTIAMTRSARQPFIIFPGLMNPYHGFEATFDKFALNLNVDAELVLALMGLDALMVDIDNWRILAQHGQIFRKRIVLLIGESDDNWNKNALNWDPTKWTGSIMGRRWAKFDLIRLVNNDIDEKYQKSLASWRIGTDQKNLKPHF